jgi:single-strand DNA-binding protein
MPSYNKVILLGNLTRDPELRITPKGTATCQLGLAVNRQFKDESGATRDDTTFVDIEARRRADALASAEIDRRILALSSPHSSGDS